MRMARANFAARANYTAPAVVHQVPGAISARGVPVDGAPGSAMYGAAWRAIADRLPVLPDNCGPEELPTVRKILVEIGGWSTTQEEPVRSAYQFALADILNAANARVENIRRAMKMNELYETIPKPPLQE